MPTLLFLAGFDPLNSRHSGDPRYAQAVPLIWCGTECVAVLYTVYPIGSDRGSQVQEHHISPLAAAEAQVTVILSWKRSHWKWHLWK